MGRARTLLVGANDVFLDGVVEWIAQDPQLEIVGRANTAAQAFEQIEALRVDLALVDVILPDLNGFEVSRRLKARANAPLVVLLSFYDTQGARLEAWAAGADGFVPQSATTTHLKPLVGDLFRRRNTAVREVGAVSSTNPVPPKDVAE